MNRSLFALEEEFDGTQDASQRGGTPRPEMSRTRKSSSRRFKVRTRSRPNNAAVNKGMHKRRKKRIQW